VFGLSVFLRDRLLARSTFTAEEIRIGRSADNEVHLENLSVSRYHASIESVRGAHILKDFGSDNGTFVNGERVLGRRALNDGDRIALSKFTLVFRGDRPVGPERAGARDAASYAVAGQTMVASALPAVRERRCPFTAYFELERDGGEAPVIHRLDRDVCAVGSAAESDLILASCSLQAALLVRGWQGFTLVSLAPGIKHNKKPLAGRAALATRDEVVFGTQTCRFFVNDTEAAS
jgi:hypothetical protein